MTVERVLAARTDLLLFESVFIANGFKKRVGSTGALVRIVQNGIKPTEFTPIRPNADAADFIYVGELRSAKGIDTLIEATAALSRRRGEMLKLLLVGTGPDEQKLVRQAEAAGIAAQVTFAGTMPAPVAFTLGRILVVPSRAESLPYIVLEAVGAQIPIIATDVGGINEIFGPYRERLIACDDPALLAREMERMLDMDPALVRQQAEDLATFASTRFSVATMADSVVAGYRDAIARRALLADDAKRSPALHS
jgi:glycosyltransferase involved in cell wall biosynthesis